MPFIPTPTEQRQNPYEVVGTTVAGTSDVYQALKRGGLDWTVEMGGAQGVHFAEDGTTTELPIAGKRSVIRMDNGVPTAAFGPVGNVFHPLQNAWVAEQMQRLVDVSGLEFQAMGYTHGGARTFMQLSLEDENLQIGGKDPIGMSLVIRNNHEGNGSLIGTATGIRLACTNQFPAMDRTATFTFRIRHSISAMTIGMDQLREALNLTYKVGNDIVAIGDKLVEIPMDVRQFENFVKEVLPPKEHPNKPGEESPTSLAQRAQLIDIFTGAENLDNVRGTRWAGLQAIIEDQDWGLKRKVSNEVRMVERVGSAEAVKAAAVKLLLPA